MYERHEAGVAQILLRRRYCDEKKPTASTSPAGLVAEPMAGGRCIASHGPSKWWLSGRLAGVQVYTRAALFPVRCDGLALGEPIRLD